LAQIDDLVTGIDNLVNELLHPETVINTPKQAEDDLIVSAESFDEVVL